MTSDITASPEFGGLPQGELLRICFDAAPAGTAMFDREMRYLAVNRAYRESLGLGDRELIGRSHYDVLPELPEHIRAVHRRCLAGATESGDASMLERADGRVQWMRYSVQPWRETSGAIGGIVIFLLDVSDRMRGELERRRLADAFHHAAIGIYIVAEETKTIIAANAAYAALRGKTLQQLIGTPVLDAFVEEQIPRATDLRARADAEGRVTFDTHFRRDHGAPIPVQVHMSGVHVAGNVRYRFASVIDLTEQEKTQAVLRQAHKMEAVGHLTGGVAHDFNNLLTVIVGSLEMLLEQRRDDQAVQDLAGPALVAAERGARLTQQLLAFGRRQPLRPQRFDLNELLSETVQLLDRTLNKSITIVTEPAADLWPVNVDRAQLEAALINLAANARDAMPQGGRLTFRTANRVWTQTEVAAQTDSVPGDYAMIEVADSGTGMTPDVLARIFEPFFTTKEVGKGSGLGLSMVYGFVKQSRGHLTVTTTPGAGTAMRIYLPRVVEPGATVAAAAPSRRDAAWNETVLVVEDDAAVRLTLVTLLGRLGYKVIEAADAAKALAVLQSDPVDVLLTDVIMPGGMSGRDLARRAHEQWPNLRILLTSGYPGDPVEAGGPALPLLPKPYRIDDLACALRQVIETPMP